MYCSHPSVVHHGIEQGLARILRIWLVLRPEPLQLYSIRCIAFGCSTDAMEFPDAKLTGTLTESELWLSIEDVRRRLPRPPSGSAADSLRHLRTRVGVKGCTAYVSSL
jgi:hypothetical protein